MLELEGKQRTRKDVPTIFHTSRQSEKEASMTGLSFKSAVFSLVIVCFLSGSAVADTFTFQDDAFLNAESMDFTLSGPSFFIHSGFMNGPNVLAVCTQGTLCTVPSQDIPANSFQPGF